MNNFAELRTKIDGKDNFMRGNSDRGGARASHAARFKRQTDKWAIDDEQVRRLLLRSFPNMDKTEKQRRRAGFWALIIYRYFRAGETARTIACHSLEKRIRIWKPKHPRLAKARFESEVKRVEDTIRRIRKAAAGLRTDGKPRSSVPKGRPKKEIVQEPEILN